MLDYINGNKFLDIADFAIDFDHNNVGLELFKNNAIIYCKTDFLNQLFDYMRWSRRKYILISHMSDYPINEARFKSAPQSIVKWYAQNAIYDHPNLISVPLGLENHKGRSKGKFTNHQWFEDNVGELKNIPKDCALYCNWNINTNREVRANIIETLQQNDLQIVFHSNVSYEEYCEHMAHHKFIVCPPGNGADTHRLWEALYLGCYPITLENRIYRDYDLPILQVKKWSDITYDLLDQHFLKWKDKKSFDQLKMSWWQNLIKEEFINYK